MAATAATRLMVVTAPIFPSSTRDRGAGVRSRLSSVLRSRSPAVLSSAAEKPPVRIIVMRMYGRKKLRKEFEAAWTGELSGGAARGGGGRMPGSVPGGLSAAAACAAAYLPALGSSRAGA